MPTAPHKRRRRLSVASLAAIVVGLALASVAGCASMLDGWRPRPPTSSPAGGFGAAAADAAGQVLGAASTAATAAAAVVGSTNPILGGCLLGVASITAWGAARFAGRKVASTVASKIQTVAAAAPREVWSDAERRQVVDDAQRVAVAQVLRKIDPKSAALLDMLSSVRALPITGGVSVPPEAIRTNKPTRRRAKKRRPQQTAAPRTSTRIGPNVVREAA